MIVLLMTEGDLLFLFSAQGLAVGAVVHGGTVHHGISTLTAFQTAAKPNQMVRKTTMPIMAPSRSSASQASTDSAVSKPGSEIEISFSQPVVLPPAAGLPPAPSDVPALR